MKKLFEIVLVAVVFFSLGMYVGQEKDVADTTVATTETTTVAKVPEVKPNPQLKPKAVTSKNLAVVYTFDEDIETEYNEFTEKQVQTIGFALTDPHKRVNDHYEEKYGSTKLDFLSFQSIVNDGKIKPLLNIDPRIAAFSPFNLFYLGLMPFSLYFLAFFSKNRFKYFFCLILPLVSLIFVCGSYTPIFDLIKYLPVLKNMRLFLRFYVF